MGLGARINGRCRGVTCKRIVYMAGKVGLRWMGVHGDMALWHDVLHVVGSVGVDRRVWVGRGVLGWSPGHVLRIRRMRGDGVRDRVRGVRVIHEAGDRVVLGRVHCARRRHEHSAFAASKPCRAASRPCTSPSGSMMTVRERARRRGRLKSLSSFCNQPRLACPGLPADRPMALVSRRHSHQNLRICSVHFRNTAGAAARRPSRTKRKLVFPSRAPPASPHSAIV